ncbi:MAG: phosphate/phosphite/phosphonate ABC transporter substrate-binding protein [Burkholderiaceae bacterium]
MKLLISMAIVGILTFSSSQEVLARTFVFGVVPQQSAQKLAAKWSPVFNYLSKKSGHRLVFSTAKSIPEFEKRLANGRYDFAYMNPYHFTVFNRSPGYKAFGRQRNKKIKGIVVVPKDSPITSIDQLEDLQLAFPAPAAFAASVLPRAKFRTEGISISPTYVRSHDSVYLAVSKGFFAAGGGVMRTFNNTDPEVRAKLRVLWTTQSYTPHAFASHPDIGDEVVADVARALVSMNDDPEGQALLATISFKGMQTASNQDWDDVRGLGIDLLDELIND